MALDRFSTRQGYVDSEMPITIREEAPEGLRARIISAVYGLDLKPSFLRSIICEELDLMPDRGNWSEWPNISLEVEELMLRCDWYHVYDIIEAIAHKLRSELGVQFHNEINDYLKRKGIGWKLQDGIILFRGDNAFEENLKKAEKVLNNSGKQTAGNEIKEAILDLSRKPKPDITGAIQHSLASLECVSREAANDKKPTLGELIKKYKSIIPPPLDIVIEKAWGYSSEQGRHLQEGREPDFEEAELMVGLCASISTYMARKITQTASIGSKSAEATSPEDDLPF